MLLLLEMGRLIDLYFDINSDSGEVFGTTWTICFLILGFRILQSS